MAMDSVLSRNDWRDVRSAASNRWNDSVDGQLELGSVSARRSGGAEKTVNKHARCGDGSLVLFHLHR